MVFVVFTNLYSKGYFMYTPQDYDSSIIIIIIF